MWLVCDRQEMHTKCWWGNLLENVHLENKKKKKKKNSRADEIKVILRTQAVRMGDRWNWIKSVSMMGFGLRSTEHLGSVITELILSIEDVWRQNNIESGKHLGECIRGLLEGSLLAFRNK
jgi:hypothetical protein